MVMCDTADKNKDNMGKKTGMAIMMAEFPVHGNTIVHREEGCHAAGGECQREGRGGDLTPQGETTLNGG